MGITKRLGSVTFLSLQILVGFGFRQVNLTEVNNIISNIAKVAVDITKTITDSLAVKNFLNWIILGNLALHYTNAGALDPNCNKIIIEPVCPNENITFWLYTNTTNEYQLKEFDIANLRKAPFIKDTSVNILIHGYTGNKSYAPNPQIKPEYVAVGHNVISVDYRPAALSPCYIQSVTNFPIVSNCTAKFIMALLKHTKIKIRSIHVIGLSLGAHIAGLTGSLLSTANANLKLKRITALDPAGPLFKFRSYIHRKYADFVQVIHTNAGVKGEIHSDPHINFYVNGGTNQPACNGRITCSHEISSTYFGEAINSSINPTKGFYGIPLQDRKCNRKDQVIMGPYTPPRNYKPRDYFVATNSLAPFGKGPLC